MDNRKAVAEYAKALEELKKSEVVIGLPMGKADANVIDYGAVHEFGSPEKNIPRRSFLRAPILNREIEIKRFMDSQAKKLEEGADPKVMLGKIGAYVQGIVLKAFRSKGDGSWEDIKESTKKAKGSSAPLIDKGQLIQSIKWEVRSAT